MAVLRPLVAVLLSLACESGSSARVGLPSTTGRPMRARTRAPAATARRARHACALDLGGEGSSRAPANQDAPTRRASKRGVSARRPSRVARSCGHHLGAREPASCWPANHGRSRQKRRRLIGAASEKCGKLGLACITGARATWRFGAPSIERAYLGSARADSWRATGELRRGRDNKARAQPDVNATAR